MDQPPVPKYDLGKYRTLNTPTPISLDYDKEAEAGLYDKDNGGISQDRIIGEGTIRLNGAGPTKTVPVDSVEIGYDPTSPLEDLKQLAGGMLDVIAPDWRTQHHMSDTPLRFAKQLQELTTREEFKFTTFESTSDEMVVLGPIPFYTLCAHHVIPFYGKAHIGYVPDKTIAGLSKFTRLVKWAAKGLWVQEELTSFIAEELQARLNPRGVAVMLEGEHMCMSMRGVAVPGVITTTSSMKGVFGDHTRTAKAEFMAVIKRG